jgi:hypothetical protein
VPHQSSILDLVVDYPEQYDIGDRAIGCNHPVKTKMIPPQRKHSIRTSIERSKVAKMCCSSTAFLLPLGSLKRRIVTCHCIRRTFGVRVDYQVTQPEVSKCGASRSLEARRASSDIKS